MSTDDFELGPVDVVVIGYPADAPRTGEAIPLFVDLVDRGVIRVLDVHMVEKGADGSVAGFELADLGEGFSELKVFEGARSGMLGDEDAATRGRGARSGRDGPPDLLREHLGGPLRHRRPAQRRKTARIPASDRPGPA